MSTSRLAALALVVTLGLAGCGSSDDGSSTTKDSGGTTTIDITFKGDTVTPDGTEVKVTKGKPVKLHVTADKPGELHVHSSPEIEIPYVAGTTDKTITLDQPGVVEIESHDLDKVVVQLEVR